MRTGYVLHHRHLRHVDHAAMQTAAAEHEAVVPIFIFDPHFYEQNSLACDARLRFMHECLADISDEVTFYHGDPVEIVSALDGDVYTIHTATGRYGVERNERLHDAGVEFVQGDGLRRVEQTRDGWSDAVQEWIEGDYYSHDESAIETRDSDVTIEWVEDEYDVSPEKEAVPTGGRSAALDQIDTFCESEYWGHISEPGREQGASGLSAYLRFGCVSVRETYQRVAQRFSDGRDLSAFRSRLFWNLHYNQKLLDWPGWMDEAVNPALRDIGTFDQARWQRLKTGQTGYPMIDAAVRQLTATGWLNFRNRAMLASFHGHLLNLPWKRGADWMYYHLIDADPGINYTQWQHQTSRVGTNMFRIYNPRKQVRDSDEAAEWIARWVPELADVPEQYLDQPEKMPVVVQEACETRIGDDYPRPVVEYEAARSRARQRLESLEAEAAEWFRDQDFRERASFSSRGGDRVPEVEAEDSNQASLSDF